MTFTTGQDLVELRPISGTFYDMRTLLLPLLFLSLASAAELEQITTIDGRRLVGFYDDIAGTMTLDGPGAAVIKLRPEQVKSRETFLRDNAPVAERKAPPAERAPAQRNPKAVVDALKSADADLSRALHGSTGEHNYEPLKGTSPEALADQRNVNGRKRAYEAAKERCDKAYLSALDAIAPGAAEAVTEGQEAEARAAKIRSDAEEKMRVIAEKIAALPTVELTLSADPTRSETERKARSGVYNGMIHRFKELVRTKQRVGDDVLRLLEDRNGMQILVEFSTAR